MLKEEVIINKSKTYLLYYFKEIFGLEFIENIINTYLFYEKEECICILYKFDGKRAFCDFESKLEKNQYYVKTVDVSVDMSLYVFEYPDELTAAISLFFKGKYSELPEIESCIDFLKRTFGLTEESKITRILRKDKLLKKEIEEHLGVFLGDLDLSSIPCIDKENFTLKNEKKEQCRDNA